MTRVPDRGPQRLPSRVDAERLVLRRWAEGDAPTVHALVSANVDHLRPFMDWIAFEPLTVEDRQNLIAGWQEGWEAGGDAVFGAFAADQAIGACGLHRRSGDDTLEIGYWVAADRQGQGYATEIARALTAAAFTVPGIARAELRIDDANVAS
ncbi:MAG: GNAT family N-acetyltransferase, partial [Actinomycetota bacterium]